MASVAIARLERHVLGERCGDLEHSVVTFGTKILPIAHEEALGPGVGIVTGSAESLFHRCVEDRKTRSSTNLPVAIAAQVFLDSGKHRLATTAMGFVTIDAGVYGRSVNDLGAQIGRVIVALDAKRSAVGNQQARVIRLVSEVTAGALLSRRVRVVAGQRLSDLAVAL